MGRDDRAGTRPRTPDTSHSGFLLRWASGGGGLIHSGGPILARPVVILPIPRQAPSFEWSHWGTIIAARATSISPRGRWWVPSLGETTDG